MISRAPEGQTAAHSPHAEHGAEDAGRPSPEAGTAAPRGQTAAHFPQELFLRHRSGLRKSSGANERPSGLWHHAHLRGQPLRKKAVRMPGPSWMEYFRMSKTMPFIAVR